MLARISLAIGLSITSAATYGQVLYRVTDLGHHSAYNFSTVALGLNNRDQVVGWVQGGSATKAFVWQADTGIVLLPPVPGHEDSSSAATAINDLGEVVGYSGTDNGVDLDGWVYRNGQYTMLGTLPGFRGSKPLAINNLAEIVGHTTPFSLLGPPADTFYWTPAAGMVDLTPGATPPAEVYDINDAGVACGGYRNQTMGVTLWDTHAGTSRDLGNLPDSDLGFGYAINDAGTVAGVSIYITTSGHRTPRGIFGGAQPLEDVGVLLATAIGINSAGDVVGWANRLNNPAYLGWIRTAAGQVLYLHDHIDQPAVFPFISDVRGINDAGLIIAQSNNNDQPDPFRRAVLLTPVERCPGDANGDRVVDLDDLLPVLGNFGVSSGATIADGDVDIDGDVDLDDLLIALGAFGTACP